MDIKIPKGTKVLITGASGFTGSLLLKKLVESGISVKAIVRKSSNILQFKGLNAEWIYGNVFDTDTVNEAVKDVEYIFHIAAAYREAKLSYNDYYNVHVVSTELLAKAALKNSNFKRFIHVSTVGVHGDIKNPPADETYPFNPGDDYQKTKALAENFLHDFAKQNNLPYTVIRPAGIYGPNDKRLLKVFKFAKRKIFPVLGFGKCLYHLIHVEDLTNAMILSATNESALNEAFIVGNKEPYSIIEMGKVIGKAYGKNIIVLRIPALPFYILGYLCEIICKPFGIEPPIYRRRVAFYTKDRSFDTKKLINILGYTPKISNEEGIKNTALWYKENKWL